MRKIFFYISYLIHITTVVGQTNDAAFRQKHFNTTDKIAIGGYDPVAYFTANKAIRGSKNYAVEIKGVVYYCASSQNKELLASSPEKYEPQYGGWCAYAMGAKAQKVEIDPETFKISNGKLYLFYNKYLTNTLYYWNKEEDNLKAKADVNWQRITK